MSGFKMSSKVLKKEVGKYGIRMREIRKYAGSRPDNVVDEVMVYDKFKKKWIYCEEEDKK